MNRSARYLLACCLLLSGLPLLGARPMQEPRAVITDPKPNATVRGRVAVTGSASIDNFQFYKVEWGRGANPSEWNLIGSTYPTPVRDGVLVQWDTTTLPDGVYSLRLHVVKADGNYSEYIVPQVLVTNKRPTETPTPAPTPRPEETRGPTPTAGPTATLAILQPTAALARPSPTPTPVRPSPRDALPQLPTSMWREALCMGVGAMAAISAVLGMVFALRRLL